MTVLDMAEVITFARCPLEWFFEHRAGLPRPHTPAALAAHGLRQALRFFYEGHVTRLSDAVLLVWRDWCAQWQQPDLADDLVRYARGRARLLAQFEQGRLRAPGGRAYKAPAWTARYRELMHRDGLLALGARLDAFAEAQGLRLPTAEDAPPGSRFADPLADSLSAAGRVEANTAQPLPTRELLLALDAPFTCDLEGGLSLTGVADLALRAPPEAGPGAVWLEIHQFTPRVGMRLSLAARDLRLIAACLSCGTGERAWESVAQVSYRYWPTGEAYTFREVNAGLLRSVLVNVALGLQVPLVIPRALSGYEHCRGCAYQDECWRTGWESWPLVDPGLFVRAERARRSVNVAEARHE
jgi:hypothetical protein